ncbi:MAG TPA: flagellar hook-associated protein FlgL [Chloroflexota bacterium]|nr:flagellar hook-associated protein FlgL [Chloroflexota bacterium]
MRITYGMSAGNSLRNIELNQNRMATIEGQLTSGSQIAKPSDDPVGAARAIGFQQSIDQSNQYLKNIDQGTNWLNSTDAALGSVTADLQRARELAVQAANGTLSPPDKRAIQLEIGQLQQSVLDLSNSKVGSSYLFSGTRSDQPGYQSAVSSQVVPWAYKGNAVPVQREVSPGVSVAVSADPQATFDPIFKALAQIQAGLTDPAGAPAASTSAVIAASAAPTANPVLIAGSLTINGVNITLAPGDDPVAKINAAFPAPSPNGVTASLTAPAPAGKLVLTSNTPGSQGNVTVGSASGAVDPMYAYLGLSATSATGVDNAGGIQATLQASLTGLDTALDAINVSRAGVGAKMNRLTTLQGQQTAVNTNLQGLLSQVKDVDMAQAITSFTMAQTVYQASLKSAAQALQPSLLDFLK